MKHAETYARIIKRTNEMEVGRTYFLSSFYEREGAMVKVVSVSTKRNSAGWPSSVTVEVVECIAGGSFHQKFYRVGTLHTVNATNLYENREDASHRRLYPSYYPIEEKGR